MINALNVAFTVMKKIVVSADALDLKNGKQKKKLKIIVQNVVNENRILDGRKSYTDEDLITELEKRGYKVIK